MQIWPYDAQDLCLDNTNTNNIGRDRAQEEDQDQTKCEGPNQDQGQEGRSLQVRTDVPNTQPNPRQEPSALLCSTFDQKL